MAVLAIDFDGVIHDPTNIRKGYKMGQPKPDAVAALQRLSFENTIIIHTTWGDTPQHIKAIGDWLEYFHIPYNSITNQKPEADWYIDNKALPFEDNWPEILTKLTK